jgi:DNA-binding CsgD family transcriptional regulator
VQVHAVVGREQELDTLCEFVTSSREGAGAFVLAGEAGIGKTTLWLAGLRAARGQGVRVLMARPAAAERDLAYTGLSDLLEEVIGQVLPALPAPRRRALEVALLLVDAEHRAPDPRGVGVGALTALRALAESGPLLLAVDDVQWLDGSSSAALEFALRRLEDTPVSLLLARRQGESGPSPERALPAERIETLELGPLSLGATHRLLRERLGRSFPRPTLVRVHELSGGNPFFALELACALERAGATPGPGEPFPVPETLEALVHDRLAALPEGVRPILLAAAAMAEPTLPSLTSEWPDAAIVLEPALRSGVVGLEGERVRFSHPLLASVLYEQTIADARVRLHARLAGMVADPVERARHLALASDTPDALVARGLDEAAAASRARGAPIAAADLGELAIRATPPAHADDRRRRLLEAARDHLAAGMADRARSLGQQLLIEAPAGRSRAEALFLLGKAEANHGRIVKLHEHALIEATGAPDLQATIHAWLAPYIRFSDGLRAGEAHARSALELAEQAGDAAIVARSLASLARLRFQAGEEDGIVLAQRSLELARRAGDAAAVDEAITSCSSCLLWTGRLAAARELLLEGYAVSAGRDEALAADRLWFLSLVEFRAGNWALADDYALRCREIAVMFDEGEYMSFIPRSLLAAHRGDEEDARALAEQGIGLATAAGVPFLAHSCRGVIGRLDLWAGDPASALHHLEPVHRAHKALGYREPGHAAAAPDLVEALLELGRFEDALAVLEPWEADAARLGCEWALGQTTRCRGLLAAARGAVEEALPLMEEAVGRHQSVGDPFGRARALLALGVTRRRARIKRAAREAVEAALDGFATLGAQRWGERAQAELGRIGGRTRQEDLTHAERRVAALVAEGKTNREVAAALFLSERTVESHLTRVYAKLGVRSRTQLARALQ